MIDPIEMNWSTVGNVHMSGRMLMHRSPQLVTGREPEKASAVKKTKQNKKPTKEPKKKEKEMPKDRAKIYGTCLGVH